MEKRRRILLLVIWALAIGNFTRLQGNEHITAIHFVSIFTIGLLSGLLLHELMVLWRKRKP
jgi:hypothetical protein